MTSFPRELAHGYGAVMHLDPSRLLLAFKRLVDMDATMTTLGAFGFVLEDWRDTDEKRLGVPEVVNHTSRRLWISSRNRRTIRSDRYRQLIAALEPVLDWVGPVYRSGASNGRHGLVCPLPHVLVIKPASPRDVARQLQLTRLLAGLGLREVREKSAFLGGYQYFQIDAREHTVYDMHAIVRADRTLVDEVHFENMPMVAPGALTAVRSAFPSEVDADPLDADERIADHPPPQMLSAR